jgi:CRP/FNR family cyclic AMP-dependent transcriptional regulator
MAQLKSRIDAVREHGILKDLDPQFVEKLAGMALEAQFRPDQIVFREGDESGFFYLVISGTIALEMMAAGHAIRVQTLHEGDAMGWSALLAGDGKHFQARATSHVRALAFEGVRVREAFDQDPAFGYAMTKRLLRTVVERLDATRVQLADSFGKTGLSA